MKVCLDWDEFFSRVNKCEDKEILEKYSSEFVNFTGTIPITECAFAGISKFLERGTTMMIQGVANAILYKYKDKRLIGLLIKHSRHAFIRNKIRKQFSIDDLWSEDVALDLYCYYGVDCNVIELMGRTGRRNNIALSKYIEQVECISMDDLENMVSDDEHRYLVVYHLGWMLRRNRKMKISKYVSRVISDEVLRICEDHVLRPRVYFVNDVIKFNGIEFIREIIESVSDRLVPWFDDMIRKIDDMFVQNGEFRNIMVDVVRCIGIEAFLTLKKVSAASHGSIFQKVHNNDISVFFALYKEDSDFIMCLPSICSFCTDHGNIISELKKFMTDVFDTQYSVVVHSLSRLFESHTENLETKIVLGNPISHAMSKGILECFCTDDFWGVYLEMFLKHNRGERESGFEYIAKRLDTNRCNEILEKLKIQVVNEEMYTKWARVVQCLPVCNIANREFVNFLFEEIYEGRNLKANYRVLEVLCKHSVETCQIAGELIVDERIGHNRNNEWIKVCLLIFESGELGGEFHRQLFHAVVIQMRAGKKKLRNHLEYQAGVGLIGRNSEFIGFLVESLESDNSDLVEGSLWGLCWIIENNPKMILWHENVFERIASLAFAGRRYQVPILKIFCVYLRNDMKIPEIQDAVERFIKAEGPKSRLDQEIKCIENEFKNKGITIKIRKRQFLKWRQQSCNKVIPVKKLNKYSNYCFKNFHPHGSESRVYRIKAGERRQFSNNEFGLPTVSQYCIRESNPYPKKDDTRNTDWA